MARTRYQTGSLNLRKGLKRSVWVGTWREDVINDAGTITRKLVKQTLGGMDEYPTRKLALRALQVQLDRINAPQYTPLNRMTFRTFAQKWMDLVMVTHMPASQSSEKAHIAKLNAAFGDVPVSLMTPIMVQEFISTLDYSPKTVRNVISTLRLMWKKARVWKLSTDVITADVTLPKKSRARREPMSLEDVRRLIHNASPEMMPLYWLLCETGMRMGEWLGLQWGDVDWVAGTITIRRKSWRGQLQVTKTEAGERVLLLSEGLLRSLRTIAGHSSAPVLPSKSGTHQCGSNVMKSSFRPYCEGLGIERIGTHVIRHFNASMMGTRKIALAVRKARLGHAAGLQQDITIDCYTHVSIEDQREWCEAFEALIQPEKGEGIRVCA